MPPSAISRAHHLSVTVVQDGTPVGYRVLDMRTDYSPLVKELAWRATAANPSLAGAEWTLTVGLSEAEPSSPRLVLEAHQASENSRPSGAKLLAALEVPASTFGWIAHGVAAGVQATGEYTYLVTVQEPDSKVVADWNASDADEDFDLIGAGKPRLTLPAGFSVAALAGPRRAIDAADSWLRCVFQRQAFEEFLAAAAKEREVERSWLGLGHVRLGCGACSVVIEGGLVELPGEAGRAWIVTHGRDWARLQRRFGDRIVAFLHLHPSTIDGEPLSPRPSESDAVVAWNVSLSSASPAVFPIAMFGACAGSPDGGVAAYGYERGLLRRIQLEVLL